MATKKNAVSKRPKGKLTEQKKRVVEAYFKMAKPRYDLAYIEAGGKAKAKDKAGSEIMSYPECQEYLAQLQAERLAEVKIDANWLLKRLSMIAEFNLAKFISVNKDGLAYYDFTTATDDDWYCISELTVDQISKGAGEDMYYVDRVKLKPESKMKALELIGRHVDVQAFREKLEVELVDKRDALSKARERVIERLSGK